MAQGNSQPRQQADLLRRKLNEPKQSAKKDCPDTRFSTVLRYQNHRDSEELWQDRVLYRNVASDSAVVLLSFFYAVSDAVLSLCKFGILCFSRTFFADFAFRRSRCFFTEPLSLQSQQERLWADYCLRMLRARVAEKS